MSDYLNHTEEKEKFNQGFSNSKSYLQNNEEDEFSKEELMQILYWYKWEKVKQYLWITEMFNWKERGESCTKDCINSCKFEHDCLITSCDCSRKYLEVEGDSNAMGLILNSKPFK